MEVALHDVYERVRFLHVICERFSAWELVGGSYGSLLEELKFSSVKFLECFSFQYIDCVSRFGQQRET